MAKLVESSSVLPSVAIRRAVSEDYATLCALFGEADALHRRALPWLFQEPEVEPRSQSSFSELLASSEGAVFVAEASGVVGAATVLLRHAPSLSVFVQQQYAVLDSLVVAEAWRRAGVGTALTRAAEHWARAHGARWLELGVYQFNEGARAFYEKLGYVPLSAKLRRPLDEGEQP
jgi:ribosomal protein S18 acetylase RimI-like enzyme